jgi:hypothetical protein
MAYVFSALLGQIPMLAVLVIGFVLVGTRRSRLGPRSATLAMAGLGFLTFDHVLQTLWTVLFPRLVASLDLRPSGFGMISFTVGLVLALLTAVGIGLLIAALVTRSPPPADPPGYGPGHATPDQPSRG